ncbi:hypothetical protein J437_LFUL011162 [Ladona fulva]|uniref:Uncharacterized protein n=1 Tax=Ladona fulva TaxID=123851 RepID=A0A8K0K3G3_LADFU|nr:hypothetical protein J437_LFUL011162 [Ladona fulva]
MKKEITLEFMQWKFYCVRKIWLALTKEKNATFRLKENELRAQILEEEKEIITQHSSELLSSLNDLVIQQGLAEADLRLEVRARLEAERQLQSAHHSVQNLEGALTLAEDSDTLRSKILPDVKRLRKFFEQIAEEAKIDANMPVIMKNSVYAKKTIAKRAMAKQIEQNRLEKAKTLGFDCMETSSVGGPLKRSLSIMITKKSLRPNITRSWSFRSGVGELKSPEEKSLMKENSSADDSGTSTLPSLAEEERL